MSGSKSQVFRKDTALWIQRQKSNRFSGYAIVHKLSRLYFSILHSPNQKDVHIHRRTPKTRFFTILEEIARVCVCVCVCLWSLGSLFFSLWSWPSSKEWSSILIRLLWASREIMYRVSTLKTAKCWTNRKWYYSSSSQEFSYTAGAWWFSHDISPNGNSSWKVVMS